VRTHLHIPRNPTSWRSSTYFQSPSPTLAFYLVVVIVQLTLHNRRLDPIFAISIGLAAAFTRINREEKEKGRSTQESVDVFRRRWSLAWESKEGEKGKGKV
jgi:hypothetical protein